MIRLAGGGGILCRHAHSLLILDSDSSKVRITCLAHPCL